MSRASDQPARPLVVSPLPQVTRSILPRENMGYGLIELHPTKMGQHAGYDPVAYADVSIGENPHTEAR